MEGGRHSYLMKTPNATSSSVFFDYESVPKKAHSDRSWSTHLRGVEDAVLSGSSMCMVPQCQYTEGIQQSFNIRYVSISKAGGRVAWIDFYCAGIRDAVDGGSGTNC